MFDYFRSLFGLNKVIPRNDAEKVAQICAQRHHAAQVIGRRKNRGWLSRHKKAPRIAGRTYAGDAR